MRKSVLAAAAAVSMIGASSGALAQSAAPLSVAAADVRAGADMDEANDYRGGYIIPGLVILVIGVLIYVLTKNNDPASP